MECGTDTVKGDPYKQHVKIDVIDDMNPQYSKVSMECGTDTVKGDPYKQHVKMSGTRCSFRVIPIDKNVLEDKLFKRVRRITYQTSMQKAPLGLFHINL
uniref:Uncharacterized protein n=1 Tax=Pithovirus LCPAC401 TaxID=2506595 RepID=A0A481ZBK9_9VIRU|nr:MAG: hypothetical protein LCPAC401_03700 [Pithovirus LCPAC401]